MHPYFRLHVFCCTNERPENHPRGSCAARGSVKLRNYLKVRAKELGLGDVRINAAGCLDRCEHGPVMVIYPEGVWYTYTSIEDIEAILTEHIQQGRPVEHLRIQPNAVC